MDTLTADAMPGATHPAYADMDGPSLVQSARRRSGYLLLPKEQAPSLVSFALDEMIPTGASWGTHQLRLRRVVAPAPYVGTPQRYTWEVLVDELGRCIADDQVWRVVDQSRASIEGWQGADDELP